MFKENVILIDADYIDSVAYHLSSNFSQMLFRDVPDADLASWLVCVALDGGVPEGKNEVQAIFVHSHDKLMMEQFYPANLSLEIDGTAFMDNALGEFLMSCVKIEELSGDDLFSQCAEVALNSREVKRLMLLPEMENSGERLRELFATKYPKKDVTLFTMSPNEHHQPREMMLGFSLMHAMGIKSDEIE
ncbi:MAG: hypothetical protein HUK02_07565 [Bacteroidaceae bacterium]|nr:hypothetical protein [Bacteroidaceae bacterium]